MLRLKELRKKKGASQEEVAIFLEITQQAYANYERGARNPDPDMLSKIADYFGVSVDYLLGRSDNPSPAGEVFAASSKDEDFYGNLSEEGRRELDEYKQYLLQKYGKK